MRQTDIKPGSQFTVLLHPGLTRPPSYQLPQKQLSLINLCTTIQRSLDYTQTPQYHYELAKELSSLRKKGVLIVGSGNMVHNLRMVAWNKLNTSDLGYDWAHEAREKMKTFILNCDLKSLINYKSRGRSFDLAVPSPDHYLPLLYILALKEENEKISLFNDKAVAGSLTMTSLRIGKAS